MVEAQENTMNTGINRNQRNQIFHKTTSSVFVTIRVFYRKLERREVKRAVIAVGNASCVFSMPVTCLHLTEISRGGFS